MVAHDYPEHYCDDVHSAIALAQSLRESGEYDLFRGQRKTYDIQPSINRPNTDQQAASDRLNRFAGWVHQLPDLCSLHHNGNALLAVAQHYGIATPLLDFSYSPLISGFFASDGGEVGDTGTIICLNRERFVESWSDINQRHCESEGFNLTEIIEIDVNNLWRLQAQQGAFLRCHVDPTLLEMFSFFLHIYFPQSQGNEVLKKEHVYPSERSHIEVLLDQYFLIETYPDRERKMEELLGPTIATITEGSIKSEIVTYFVDDTLPETHPSWSAENEDMWMREPCEAYGENNKTNTTLLLPLSMSVPDLETYLVAKVARRLNYSTDEAGVFLNWTVLSSDDKKQLFVDGGGITKEPNEFTEFSVGEMVNVIYSGMRVLPYTKQQVSRAIVRYLLMAYAGVYAVMDEPVGVEFSGMGVRGRGFASEKRLYGALRHDFLDFVKPDKLDKDGRISLTDLLFLSRYIHNAYLFDTFVDMFVDDLIPSQAAVAVEGLVIGLNPHRIQVFGES